MDRIAASRPLLSRENDFVAAIGEQPPGHGDLGRVEIAIGKWDQDAHGPARLIVIQGAAARRYHAWVATGFPGRPKGLGPRSVRAFAAFLLCSVCAFLLAGPAMAATKAPEVGYLAASDVSTTGATIEAPINPEGGETSYEIYLECQNAEGDKQNCGPLTVDPQRQAGILPAGSEAQIVTDAVTGLQPGYLYGYRVVGTNSAGREGYVRDGFLTCPSQGPCPSQPYLIGESLWNIEGAEREAQEAPRLEAEREAKAREEAERPAREAAKALARQASTPVCLVPSLKGDSLSAARSALVKANCRLGRVRRSHRPQGTLVVIRQDYPKGAKVALDTRVAVALGGRRDGHS